MTALDRVLGIPNLSPRARLLVMYLAQNRYAPDFRVALALGCDERTVRRLRVELRDSPEARLALIELRP